MTRAEIAQALERGIDRLDREARDNNHDPHPWVYDDTFVAHTACRRCGKTMTVRVFSDYTFKHGLSQECVAEQAA